MATKKKNGGASPRWLHVPISRPAMAEWVKFRRALGMVRGPLEEKALDEYRKNHSTLKLTID